MGFMLSHLRLLLQHQRGTWAQSRSLVDKQSISNMAFNVAEIWRFISQSTSSAGCVCTKLSIALGSLFLCSSHYTTTHTLCVVLIYKHMGNLYIDGGAAHLTYPAAHVIGLVSYNI